MMDLTSPIFCNCNFRYPIPSNPRIVSVCQVCGKIRLYWYDRVINRLHFSNRKACPECGEMLFIDTAPNVEYWFHCSNCKIFLSPTFGVRASESSVLHGRRKEVYDTTPFPQEMVERNNSLKERDKPGIIVDAEFHKLFCKVMKEESERDCKCYGEDLPKE